jgi:hypothetical protein
LAYKDLYDAIRLGFVDHLKTTLNLGVDVNYVNQHGVTVLFHALTFVPFHSVDIAWKILSMLFDAGAKWTEKEFQKMPDPKIASINPGTMTKVMLDSVKMLEHPAAGSSKSNEAYRECCKKLAVMLDNYELSHNLKARSEIIQ